MKKFLPLAFALSVILLLCTDCKAARESDSVATNCDMLGHSRSLGVSRLQRALQLTNGPDIYIRVSEFYDVPGVIAAPADYAKSEDVTLAWESNCGADLSKWIMDFAKGTTVLDMIQKIATRRSERLIVTPNNIVIVPNSKVLTRSRSQQERMDDPYDLGCLVNSGRLVFIREPDSEGIESFINEKLGSSPYRYKESADAKKRITNFNAIGTHWPFVELFDAISIISDLQWRVDGKTVIMEKSPQ